jgi:uncharacterized tellurite resistance protein B-like protein
MKNSPIQSEVVEFVSRITKLELTREDLTPPVVFLAALVSVLTGVVHADNEVTGEEEQKLLTILERFTPSEDTVRKLTQLMISGVRENQVYANLEQMKLLMAPLLEPQRLLLIGLGYEISAADGSIDDREKQYLQQVASQLELDLQYLTILEASFGNPGNIEPAVLDKVRRLLDPAQFYELDTSFVKAADELFAKLPANSESKSAHSPHVPDYTHLQQVQKVRQELNSILCDQILPIAHESNSKDFLSSARIEENLDIIARKLKTPSFRLAVIGEFSKGKSTFLNALVGREIQPTSINPCSSVVTVLKHGTQERVICRYKDGQAEEVLELKGKALIEEYQKRVKIPPEVAEEERREALTDSNVDEIVFEHPGLGFCKNGVEILDSPGLNENPERTAMTKKLLKEIDAVIFLMTPRGLLSESERGILQDVRAELTYGFAEKPVDNLFLIINCADSLSPEEKQQVRRRLENFAKNQNLLTTTENRIYWMSVKQVLNAILNGSDTEHLDVFQSFTETIEQFLSTQRGYREIRQIVNVIENWRQQILNELQQAREILKSEVNPSEQEKQKVLEQIGEASGQAIRIVEIADSLKAEARIQAYESWQQWEQGLKQRIEEKFESWNPKHPYFWRANKAIQDYKDKFMTELKIEIKDWCNAHDKDFLQPKLQKLDGAIKQASKLLEDDLRRLDEESHTNFSQQFQLERELRFGDSNVFNPATTLAATSGLLILVPIWGLVEAVILGIAVVKTITEAATIKDKIVAQCFEQFNKVKYQIGEKLLEKFSSAFDQRVEAHKTLIEQLILRLESYLHFHEQASQETLAKRQEKESWINQKCEELERIRQNLVAIDRRCSG